MRSSAGGHPAASAGGGGVALPESGYLIVFTANLAGSVPQTRQINLRSPHFEDKVIPAGLEYSKSRWRPRELDALVFNPELDSVMSDRRT